VPDWPAMRLSHATYIDHVRADGERLAAVAERGLDPPVPSCPGWTVRDVVEHPAEVFLNKVACMRDKVYPDPWPPLRGDQHEYADIWWWDERTVGFWGRPMAHVNHLRAQLVTATQ
jgi:hypothetical protein